MVGTLYRAAKASARLRSRAATAPTSTPSTTRAGFINAAGAMRAEPSRPILTGATSQGRGNRYMWPRGPVSRACGNRKQGCCFVHGGGVTREEGGFFTRIAAGLADAGVASLRYDLRGHWDSGGRQEDSPLTVHLNDMGYRWP